MITRIIGSPYLGAQMRLAKHELHCRNALATSVEYMNKVKYKLLYALWRSFYDILVDETG